MTRRERALMTCPNQGCERYSEQTRLMGGCGDCGTQLVPWKAPEPTNEQLENFCAVLGIPIWPGWFERNPQMRDGALNLHRLFSRSAAGDPEAQEALGRWLDLFKRAAA